MRNFRLLGVALVMALLAACGDGSGDATTTTAPQATTTAPDATTTTADDSGPDGGFSGRCAESTAAMEEAMEGYTQSFSPTGGTTDFGLLKEQLEAAAEAAPAEIREDFQVLATELGKFYDVMDDFDYTPGQMPSQEQLLAMQAALESIDEEAVQTASKNLDDWFAENCD